MITQNTIFREFNEPQSTHENPERKFETIYHSRDVNHILIKTE